MNYWKNRNERRQHAIEWIEEMNREKAEETKDSIKRSIIYPAQSETTEYHQGNFNTKIFLIDCDTVQAIGEFGNEPDTGKMAALNFASYKNPGGMFIEGSSAQEECLCHSSNLYCILREFENTFYKNNRTKLNYALYNSDILYSPDVYFISENYDETKCDIITCAAPNRSAAERYHKIESFTIRTHLIDRVEHVLRAAAINNVDVLILGAFGCGVFGNSPEMVAGVFKELLLHQFKGCFKKVIFAIPDARTYNFTAFENVLNDILD